MSTIRTCDCCGAAIDPGAPFVTVTCVPSARAAANPRWTEHYCARPSGEPLDPDAPACADFMTSAVALAGTAKSTLLADIETVSPQKLAALRRKHTHAPDPER